MTDSNEHPAATPQDELGEKLSAATLLDVPMLYFNGFTQGLGVSDVVTILERNGRPVAVLNMPFTVAKTFARVTAQSIGHLEELATRDILTIQEIQDLFAGSSKTT